MVKITYSQFFTAKAVTSRVSQATRTVLSKAGAFVRRTARQSIRKRKRSAEPGNPPSSHAGTLKDLIFFGYDHRSESVVIGPTTNRASTSGPSGASLLEFGGTVRRKGKTYRYRRFPYMQPALENEAPKFPNLFRDSVR